MYIKRTNVFFLKSGFTIIELLVVIVTMTLIFGFGMARYRDFQQRQYLEGAVRMVKGDLRLAQENALSGKKPTEPAGNACETTTLNGYYFRLLPSQYLVEAYCVGGNVSVKGPVDLPPEVTMTWNGNPIFFRGLGRGVNTISDITITLTYGTYTKTVVVTAGGEIK